MTGKPNATWAARYCSKLTRLSRSNFYVAFLFLPKKQRRAMHAVYSFCRVLDDSVDEAPDPQAKEKGLERWRRYLEDAYRGRATHPVMMQLMWAIETFSLPKEYFLELIEGVAMDLKFTRYETALDLDTYCYRVASVVGLLCIRIFGYADSNTPTFAVHLGKALQWTNILRDVGKDAKLGRIYLPLEDLNRFNVTEQEILEGRITAPFQALMEFDCARAESFYRQTDQYWNAAELRTLFPAVIMKTVYRRLLKKIRACDYDVFGKQLSLSGAAKFWIALRIFTQARFL